MGAGTAKEYIHVDEFGHFCIVLVVFVTGKVKLIA